MRTILGAVLFSLAVAAAPVAAAPPDTEPDLYQPMPSVPDQVGHKASYTADCTGITVTTSEWSEGSYGGIGFNGDPPIGIPINTTAHFDPPASSTGYYYYTIRIVAPDQPWPYFLPEYGNIICESEPVVEVESAALALPATR